MGLGAGNADHSKLVRLTISTKSSKVAVPFSDRGLLLAPGCSLEDHQSQGPGAGGAGQPVGAPHYSLEVKICCFGGAHSQAVLPDLAADSRLPAPTRAQDLLSLAESGTPPSIGRCGCP